MKYLLDTNVCIDYLNGSYPNVVRRISHSKPDDLCVNSIVVAELRFGADKSRKRATNHAKLDLFLGEIRCLDFDHDAATAFGRVRVSLEDKGEPIGPYDMLIAAHALSRDLVLVSDNVGELSRVAGLVIENWRED
jgi:tRNA(fMet)-specific endonuclease VapC